MGNQARKEEWQKDEDIVDCPGCKTEFGPITRKHHCRSCGNIYCSDCSSFKLNGERVCKVCHVLGQESLEEARQVIDERWSELYSKSPKEFNDSFLKSFRPQVDAVLEKLNVLIDARQIAFIAALLDFASDCWLQPDISEAKYALMRKDITTKWNFVVTSVIFPPVITLLDNTVMLKAKSYFELETDDETSEQFLTSVKIFFYDSSPVTEIVEVVPSLDGTQLYLSARVLDEPNDDVLRFIDQQLHADFPRWSSHHLAKEVAMDDLPVVIEEEKREDAVQQQVVAD